MLDNLSSSTAFVALHLHLLEDTRRQHLFLDHHSLSVALVAVISCTVFRSAAVAVVADDLLFNLELVYGAGVEVFQWQGYAHFHVLTFSHSTEMPSSSEELAEQVEWVPRSSSSLLLLTMLLDALVSMLIVYPPQILIGKDLVRFRDFDKFLGRLLVVRVLVWMVLFR